jgi:hypothetical protein
MNAKMMLFAISIPGWNSLDAVRRIHSVLELAALAFFALLVLFDVLSHFSDDKRRERLFEKIGLCFFAIAVLAEIVAYPYGQRNDALSEQIIGSLDVKARQADSNASKALTDSGTALSQAQDAISKTGTAEGAMKTAANEALDAQRAASNALTIAHGARQEADSFETDIASAKQQAADAESHLAEAMRQAAEAKLELDRFKAPRSLTYDQMNDIFRTMLPLGPQKIDFFLYPNDGEIMGIAQPVANCLQGWTIKAVQPLGGGTVEGMLVEDDPADPLAVRRAQALVDVLAKNGLKVAGPIPSLPTPANKLPAFLGDGPIDASIRLTVGKK